MNLNFLKVFKSKTVWAGIGTVVLGSGEILQQYGPLALQFFPPTSAVGAGLTIALGGMTIYGRIKAQQPLGPVIDKTIQQTVDAVHELQGQAPAGKTVVEQATIIVKEEQKSK